MMGLSANPLVSIIIPARNEGASIARCLDSLIIQSGVSFEIIVVDDASTDDTRKIAKSFAKVRVIDAGPLQEGWTGKNNAVLAGVAQARGSWLLLTDADTTHKPGSLARAVAEAEEHRAALLSYSPEQEVRTFWEKAVMPVIFAELAASYSPTEVSDPGSPVAAANGQYILISRDAYDAVGGHAKILGDLLEDVAIARLVKSSGRRILFRYGSDAVRTRMYRNWRQMKEGWTKNLALLFSSTASLAFRRTAEFVFIVGCWFAGFFMAMRGSLLLAVVYALMGAAFYALFLNRIRRAHFRWDANLLSLLGLPVFSYLLIRSRAAHRAGTIRWKDRSFSVRRSEGQASEIPFTQPIVSVIEVSKHNPVMQGVQSAAPGWKSKSGYAN